jgi:hypothetical protein
MPVKRATRSWFSNSFLDHVLDGMRNVIRKMFLREGGVHIDR